MDSKDSKYHVIEYIPGTFDINNWWEACGRPIAAPLDPKIVEEIKKENMKNKIFYDYIADVKSQLCCNNIGETIEYITYDYTEEQIDNNLDYFKHCMEKNLSGYKALLFFSDYLNGSYNIKSYQIVE